MPDELLSDVKVLDLTHYIAGPYCTKLFADYGADVIKIERPGTGDPARQLSPFFKDEPHPEKSGLFLHLNTNKRSITLNLKTDTGQEIFKELVKEADIVVENFRPGVMANFGLDFPVLKGIKPDLVMTSISNFGQNGPYRDYKASELILYGMGGEMYSVGVPERHPLKQGGNVVQYEAGAAAAAATMGVLFSSRLQGIGQHVDVSIMETQLAGVDRRHATLLAYQYCGDIQPRIAGWMPGYPSGAIPCADGYVEIAAGAALWDRVVKMLGEPEFLKDPKWTTPTAQTDPALKEEFETFFIPWMMERTKAEVWQAGQAARVFCGPLFTSEDLLHDQHFNERGFWEEIEHPETGKVKYPGRPFKLSNAPTPPRRPAPSLGQHNEEVFSDLGYSSEELVKLRDRGVI
ncbi:MAG: CoA transferase [Dehalococcoidia bacterium]